MEYACENIGEAPLYFMNVFKRQFTFVELSLKKYMVDYFVDKRSNTCRRRVRKHP